MRKIKFRALPTNKDEFAYGHLFKDGRQCYIVSGIAEFHSQCFHPTQMAKVRAKTVGENTGIKDKNKVEIYEGDVVKVNDKNLYGKTMTAVYEVKFYEGGFFCFECQGKYKNVYPKSIRNQPGMEVIGNIHQNPELLEAK